jgi:hypothetical protein
MLCLYEHRIQLLVYTFPTRLRFSINQFLVGQDRDFQSLNLSIKTHHFKTIHLYYHAVTLETPGNGFLDRSAILYRLFTFQLGLKKLLQLNYSNA